MSSPLVLSLFPGVGLLDRAFEEAGFCVVRGPDILWGGDIRTFHPPPGRFDGIIGGPPCQQFSALANLVRHVYGPDKIAANLIPEFERCVREAMPAWFVMENVPAAPNPCVEGYTVQNQLVRDHWVGGHTRRLRRFNFGTHGGALPWKIETLLLCRPDPLPAVLASGGNWVPVKIGGSGKPKRIKVRRKDGRIRDGFVKGNKTGKYFTEAKLAQGLPEAFDLPGMTVSAKIKAVGNGVPLAMGRAVAKSVKVAFYES